MKGVLNHGGLGDKFGLRSIISVRGEINQICKGCVFGLKMGVRFFVFGQKLAKVGLFLHKVGLFLAKNGKSEKVGLAVMIEKGKAKEIATKCTKYAK